LLTSDLTNSSEEWLKLNPLPSRKISAGKDGRLGLTGHARNGVKRKPVLALQPKSAEPEVSTVATFPLVAQLSLDKIFFGE
jgi:hypothetical protein